MSPQSHLPTRSYSMVLSRKFPSKNCLLLGLARVLPKPPVPSPWIQASDSQVTAGVVRVGGTLKRVIGEDLK